MESKWHAYSSNGTASVFIACKLSVLRRLRKFRRNQILVHICATIMIGMLLSILSFRFKGNKQTCTAIALLLHYFILAALSWMCVEAYNLYRDLVKVFNNNVVSTRAFTIRACIFGYGKMTNDIIIEIGVNSLKNLTVLHTFVYSMFWVHFIQNFLQPADFCLIFRITFLKWLE